MPGTVTESFQDHRTVRKLSLAWTSDASGAVSGTDSSVVSGEILRVTFVPGAGAVQPTDLYDLTLLDEDGVDVLQGLGANLSNANTTSVAPLLGDGTAADSVHVAVDGPLSLVVAAAGNAKSGTLILYLR